MKSVKKEPLWMLVMIDFLKINGEVNIKELAQSHYCDISSSGLSKERSATPEKFNTRYLGIVCEENGITLEKLEAVFSLLKSIDILKE